MGKLVNQYFQTIDDEQTLEKRQTKEENSKSYLEKIK
jgi:hypothetical protein